MDSPKSLLKPFIEQLSQYADELEHSDVFRMRIHFEEHMYGLLDTIEKEVQRVVLATPQEDYRVSEFVVGTSLSFDPSTSAPTAEAAGQSCESGELGVPHVPKPRRLPFCNMTSAQAAKVLLIEHGQLHGKEIERRVKEGGYKTKARHFQQSLLSAFQRDGGFENIGGNVWKLKNATADPSLNGSQAKPEGDQDTAA